MSAFIAIELRSDHPMLDLGLLANGTVRGAAQQLSRFIEDLYTER